MSDAQRNDIPVAMRIAEHIKEVITGLRRDRIAELIWQHLVQLRLPAFPPRREENVRGTSRLPSSHRTTAYARCHQRGL